MATITIDGSGVKYVATHEHLGLVASELADDVIGNATDPEATASSILGAFWPIASVTANGDFIYAEVPGDEVIASLIRESHPGELLPQSDRELLELFSDRIDDGNWHLAPWAATGDASAMQRLRALHGL